MKRKSLEAEKRAEALLELHLNETQRQEYRTKKRFIVEVQDGVCYRINRGWAGNVEELNKDGKPVNRLCIHTRAPVPIPDNLLAQKLLLETDPAEFRRIANRTAIPVGFD